MKDIIIIDLLLLFYFINLEKKIYIYIFFYCKFEFNNKYYISKN